jgi:lysozyme
MFDWLGKLRRPGVTTVVPATTPHDIVLLPAPVPKVRFSALAFIQSDAGLTFLTQQEGLKLSAYRDSAGIPTIGYGSIRVDGIPVIMGQIITLLKARQCLLSDCAEFLTVIKLNVTVPLTQNQIDALVSFTYNVGGSAFLSSSLRRVINAGQPIPLDLFTRWNKVHDPVSKQLVIVPGLTLRRIREYQYFVS